jgi:hypothetical protein
MNYGKNFNNEDLNLSMDQINYDGVLRPREITT